MADFFKRLSYSLGNEDYQTERQALKVKPNDRVLCITASGDRPFHILMDDPKEVISIDLNRVQNYLLELKIAAMDHFDFEHYLAFLGGEQSNHRISSFYKIAASLDGDASNFWKKNIDKIDSGILFQGAMEVWCKRISNVIKLFRNTNIKKLFEFDDLDEQREFIKKEWDNYFWKKSFDLALNSMIARMFIKDPGLEYVDASLKPGSYIYNRMNHCLSHQLAKENVLMSLFINGKLKKEGYPLYLREEGCSLIKNRLNRIKSQTINLVHYLQSAPDNSIDCFSLSDVASYISQKDFNIVMHEIKRTARPDARFCIRQFLTCHSIPQELEKHIQRDHFLENKLEKEDRCFVYRFITGKVIHK